MPQLTEQKMTYLLPYVKGKTVLDVGCADQAGTHPEKRIRFLHGYIKYHAAEVVGIDAAFAQVEALNKLGYTEIICGDAEHYDLNRRFDVVFAGELIEHLSSPGLFLNNAYRHLYDDGLLILTTPNRFHASPFIDAMLTGALPDYKKPMAAHVAYYDINCLCALASRHGFKLVTYRYLSNGHNSIKSRFVLGTLTKLRPQLKEDIIVVFKKQVTGNTTDRYLSHYNENTTVLSV